ncbi:MAG: hypothetical protein EOO01_45260, partial [Chitinophagaceae bacterium]
MKVYQLHATQLFPKPITEIWDFMSNPANLAKITPKEMGFVTLSGESEKTYAGQVIRYTITPLFGIKMNWVTEITHVKEGEYFVDEQRYGPYAFSAVSARKDVEGAWSRLESKVWHDKGVWIVSTPAVHLAADDQRRLAMDGLRGVKVQVV